jgi:isoleucyl-tRNA synthetase
VPGWDCHGLPIEMNVEKKIGKAGIDVSAAEFLKACREYAYSQIQLQRQDFIRLGVIGDWENPYLTMNFKYEANIIRTLARIIQNGHLQHGRKPVHWCTECGSALAEAEVEYKDKESYAIDVLFRATNPQELLKRFNLEDSSALVAIPIWTTTPWTLPANEAVAVNPNHDYVLVKLNHELAWPMVIVAEVLLEEVMRRYGFDHYQKLAITAGKNLGNVRLHHPFLKREVPVVFGDHVTLDTGTGAVHTAPAHGQEDYIIGVAYKLPMDNPVNAKGVFVAGTPFFAGEHVFKVNPHVIQVVKDHHNLLHEAKIQHSYAHCWRHKTPLIYRATPQWFVSMEKNGLREQALAAIAHTKWVPEWGQARISELVQNRPDWCISRQRLWNTPMPLFIHNESNELHPRTIELMEQVAAQVEKSGIEIWHQTDIQDYLGEEAKHYHKLTDTLDVWFDSGVSHACVLETNPGLQFPADVYLEGSDQHRGWFQTSLLTSVAIHGRAPYSAVITHGYTVDAQGYKMSKSIGNVIGPEEVIHRLGADVLRFWVATTDYSSEITVSNEILERASEAYRRIRNTLRFLLSNLSDFDVSKDEIAPDQMVLLDRWAVDRAANLQDEILRAYHNFQFHQVSQKIHHFCTVDMGSFYLDILKDRLYTSKKNGLPRRSAQTALFHILEAMVRWLAPILSFTAEEVWQHMPGTQQESVLMATFYGKLFKIDQQDREFWKSIMVIRETVNKELEESRKENRIGSSLAANVTIYSDGQTYQHLKKLGNELRFVLITSDATVEPLTKNTQLPNDMEITPSAFQKCNRCWHRREDVGTDPRHPEICIRCIENIEGPGEDRKFA